MTTSDDRSTGARQDPDTLGPSRESLLQAVLETDRRIYMAILAATSEEWLRADLSNRQLKLLLVIFMGTDAFDYPGRGRESATMTHLASALGVSLPSATGIVDRLVEQGLVRRESDPADRRVVLVSLTEAGRNMMDRLRNNGRHVMSATLERLADDDLRLVAKALDLLLNAAMDTLAATPTSGTGEHARAAVSQPATERRTTPSHGVSI